MPDTITLWDHRYPCTHERAFQAKNGLYGCGAHGCPGGREITLRLIGNQKAGRVWVEVDDE